MQFTVFSYAVFQASNDLLGLQLFLISLLLAYDHGLNHDAADPFTLSHQRKYLDETRKVACQKSPCDGSRGINNLYGWLSRVL
jgi:hypothetical protein